MKKFIFIVFLLLGINYIQALKVTLPSATVLISRFLSTREKTNHALYDYLINQTELVIKLEYKTIETYEIRAILDRVIETMLDPEIEEKAMQKRREILLIILRDSYEAAKEQELL